jgi:hypothetical protein
LRTELLGELAAWERIMMTSESSNSNKLKKNSNKLKSN